MQKHFLLLTVLFFGSTLSSFAADMPIRIRMNVAHRGASFKAPENTIPAYKQAIADGATGAECDVYTTTDGVLFLCHDGTTSRTLSGTVKDEKVTSLSFAELRKRDAGAWKGQQFKGTVVPTLDEYLQVLKGTECYPVIEIKMDGIADKVAEAVHNAKMLDVSSVISFSEKAVKDIRRIEPKLPVAWLYSENLKGKGTVEENADRLAEFLIKKCKELDTPMLDLAHNILSEKLIKKLQAEGIHVWAWTVDEPARMEQLLDWGIESITTNKPDVLAEILKNRNR
ncbi:MAG: hypothetical protein LBN39_01060 [Planctomycetaceae bacterium]|jgi:glycerophosphoryl diester phosphodiesterase|nr:hypothetical protein [Planctomycetaceae bacterium]